MRKAVLLLLVVLSTMQCVKAQVDHGGFGYFFAGPVYNLNPQLQKKMSDPAVLGDHLQLNTTVYAYGGAGYSIKPTGWVLGGS